MMKPSGLVLVEEFQFPIEPDLSPPMGAGASLQTLSAQDVASQVTQLGDAYKGYADLFVHNGIDGSILAILTDSDLDALLMDVGILSKSHRKLLGMHLSKLKRPVNTPPSNAPRFPTLGPSIPTHVTQPPSILLGRLLAYQGVHLIDPDDLTTVLDTICNAIAPSQCDGISTYDCFINYRVASEKAVAEKLYLHLKTRNLHPFLDRMSLKTGEPWKEGFLRGLTQSRLFVALLSTAGLAKCRDESVDHTADNLLLEYEVALAVADSAPSSFMVLPIYVAAMTGGGFIKFQDFSADLYAPTLPPPMSPRPAIDKVPRRKSIVTSVAIDQLTLVEDSTTKHRRRHSTGAEAPKVADEANRKLTLSESAAANVPELLQAARKLDHGSTSALEMLFGMAQRSKQAAKITAAGGLAAMVDVLGKPSALAEHKDIAAAVLSFLARALVQRGRQEGSDDVAWKVLLSDQTHAILLSTLMHGSNIQTQYVVVGLMHLSNSDAMVKARLREWKDLQKCLQRLAVEGSVVQRDACQELLR
ncbi:hypothetical protein DYB30_006393 [Aphanomyces astaci]|uniref:SAM domain-containing protein n=1 Tax=Aphanomyces astaci TaxID=112090 RepID=A0A397CQ41_APHAT|nr:hypothetical protein DYB30_006393 [Aphanomyces astaci]